MKKTAKIDKIKKSVNKFVMKVKEGLNLFWNFLKKHQGDIILVVGVILISLLSFAIGYIVAKEQEKEPLIIKESISEMQNETK